TYSTQIGSQAAARGLSGSSSAERCRARPLKVPAREAFRCRGRRRAAREAGEECAQIPVDALRFRALEQADLDEMVALHTEWRRGAPRQERSARRPRSPPRRAPMISMKRVSADHHRQRAPIIAGCAQTAPQVL
ncbi:unnamed protein product, partial [Prorocentrum cordatum]